MKTRLLIGALWCLFAACGETMDDGMPDAGPTAVTATFTSLYGDFFSNCAQCHSPGGSGSGAPGIEKTLDFTTKATAYMTIKTGMASGLTGNSMGCNGTPFVDAMAQRSLILAVLDESTRASFDLPGHPNCGMDEISDEAFKSGKVPSAAFIAALKTWLNAGAPNN